MASRMRKQARYNLEKEKGERTFETPCIPRVIQCNYVPIIVTLTLLPVPKFKKGLGPSLQMGERKTPWGWVLDNNSAGVVKRKNKPFSHGLRLPTTHSPRGF